MCSEEDAIDASRTIALHRPMDMRSPNSDFACMSQVCTTCLVTLVIIIVWRKHIAIAVAFFCTFIFIEGIYFSSTLFKIPHGAHPSY